MKPGLFGLQKTNRDFTSKDCWGKNQFNSSFPTALMCYMFSKGIKPIYISVKDDFSIEHIEMGVDKIFGINPLSENVYFSFETTHAKYQRYFIGTFPRNDVTLLDEPTGNGISSFEIKLTALPDNQTCMLKDDLFGTELVIRPDTIIYQAAMIIDSIGDAAITSIYKNKYDDILDWSIAKNVIPFVEQMVADFYEIVKKQVEKQRPLIIQPIWKTKGKNPILANDCLDVFVWSTYSMSKLFLPDPGKDITSINRQTRTLVWFTKMIIDYLKNGKFAGFKIIDELSFNTKNDKAFAISGLGTHPFMKSDALHCPRIKKKEIKNIILGGGQKLLSPERRFDAIICNTPNLFD
ncbi:HindVP family restriction endonuclease [Campylobacter sp. MOP7]|uniref:HindVP family restriction endonuclease n=1 Tax=Campylobacter canis TaxID=3378588 RepID=UPI00387E9FBC